MTSQLNQGNPVPAETSIFCDGIRAMAIVNFKIATPVQYEAGLDDKWRLNSSGPFYVSRGKGRSSELRRGRGGLKIGMTPATTRAPAGRRHRSEKHKLGQLSSGRRRSTVLLHNSRKNKRK
jgi:hypothetical protein